MAVASPEEELRGTGRWAAWIVVSVAVQLVYWMVMLIALASLALLFVPLMLPASDPFVWLTVVGVALSLLSISVSDEEAEFIENIFHKYERRSGREMYIYVATLLMLALAGISTLVAVTGAGATVLAERMGQPLLAVALALLYPKVEVLLAEHVGWNVTTIGALVGVVLMSAVAIASRVSVDVPKGAATDFRRQLLP